jgi:hypothetical protein
LVDLPCACPTAHGKWTKFFYFFSVFHVQKFPKTIYMTYISQYPSQVSVRNMVPTLTSRKRRGLSLNGRCKAIRDTGFILVPAEGAVCPAGACSRHCIALHRGCL